MHAAELNFGPHECRLNLGSMPLLATLLRLTMETFSQVHRLDRTW